MFGLIVREPETTALMAYVLNCHSETVVCGQQTAFSTSHTCMLQALLTDLYSLFFLLVLNASSERWGGGGGVWWEPGSQGGLRGGGGGDFKAIHCHHLNESAFNVGSNVNHVNVLLAVAELKEK